VKTPSQPVRRSFDSRLRHTNRRWLPAAGEPSAAPPPPREVAFVLLEHFSLMTFTAAVDALVTANLVSGRPLYRVRSFSLDGAGVLSDLGIRIDVDGALAQIAPGTFELVLVCGGLRSTLGPVRPLIARLRQMARSAATIGGLWNGSMHLAHAGLLAQHACAVHPDDRAGLEEQFPGVRVRPQPWVIDGQRVSCAGPNSALELMLALIGKHHGEDVVRAIEAILACDRSRERADSPLASPANDPALPAVLQVALEHMERRLEEPLAIDALAQRAGVSRRQLDRLFRRHMQSSPARYYLELRLTHARRLLLQTADPVTRIALACGFADAPHFSRCYRQFFGQAPSATRHPPGAC
jgi:transcriptional regulator GlxA family with amidase domain